MIKIENVTKLYGKNDSKITALDNCSVIFEKSKFTVITGTSGSGKTTLLNILGGLLIPDSGKVFYDDTDIISLSEKELLNFRRKNIGYIYQSFNLLPELTAEENIIMPMLFENKGIDKKAFEKITEMLGIKSRLKHRPYELSGGQQQRIAIARALIKKPDVLLCDEPTGNLDKKTSDEVIKLLYLLKEEKNQTIIMVTHDEKIALNSDYIVHIEDGKII